MSLQDLTAYAVLSAAETYVFHMFFKALLRRNERHDAIYAGGLVVYYVFQFVSYALQSPLFSMAPLYMAFALLNVFHTGIWMLSRLNKNEISRRSLG